MYLYNHMGPTKVRVCVCVCEQNSNIVIVKVVHIITTQFWKIKAYGNSNVTRLNAIKE